MTPMRERIQDMSPRDVERFTLMWNAPGQYTTTDIATRFGITANRAIAWARRFGLGKRPKGKTAASHYKRGYP